MRHAEAPSGPERPDERLHQRRHPAKRGACGFSGPKRPRGGLRVPSAARPSGEAGKTAQRAATGLPRAAMGRYGPATGVRSGVAQGSGARPTGRPAAIRLPSLRTLPVRDASASPTRGNGAVTRASLQKPRCDGLGHTAADHDGDHGQNGPDTYGFLHVRISIVASTAMNRTR